MRVLHFKLETVKIYHQHGSHHPRLVEKNLSGFGRDPLLGVTRPRLRDEATCLKPSDSIPIKLLSADAGPMGHSKEIVMHSKKSTILLLSLVVALLAGCSSQNEGPYGGHKVDWYLKHTKEDKAEMKWCGNDARRMKTINSCMNANAAEQKRWADATANPKNILPGIE